MNHITAAKNSFDDSDIEDVYRGMRHSWERRARKLQDRQLKSMMRKSLFDN